MNDRNDLRTRLYPPERVTAAARATYAAFIGAGFVFASWASRIPQVRDRLQLSPADLGLVLLAIAGGSLVALPLAGTIVHRLNSRRTVAGMSVLLAAGLATVAIGYLTGVVPVLIGLFVLGFGNGAWDVAMNVQGATVERHLGRAIMPRFHAGFSAGTVGGALSGALMVALGVPVTAHLLVVAVIVAVLVPPVHPTGLRRSAPVGSRRITGFPGRHERSSRRTGGRSRAGKRRRLHRLLRLPRRAAPHRLSRRPHHRPPRTARRRDTARRGHPGHQRTTRPAN